MPQAGDAPADETTTPLAAASVGAGSQTTGQTTQADTIVGQAGAPAEATASTFAEALAADPAATETVRRRPRT